VASAPGVRSAKQAGGAVVVETGSGRYRFSYPAAELAKRLRAREAFHVDVAFEVLLANPAARAVLDRYVPALSQNPIDETRKMTLRQLAGFAPDALSQELLKKLDAELRAIQE